MDGKIIGKIVCHQATKDQRLYISYIRLLAMLGLDHRDVILSMMYVSIFEHTHIEIVNNTWRQI